MGHIADTPKYDATPAEMNWRPIAQPTDLIIIGEKSVEAIGLEMVAGCDILTGIVSLLLPPVLQRARV